MARTAKAKEPTLVSTGGFELESYQPKKNEDYMIEGTLAHLRYILAGMRQVIMEEVDRTVSDMRDKDDRPSDVTDRATREEEMGLMLRTRNREAKLLRKIESTLDKVDSDDFGYCDSCGVEIGLRRLEARPTATLCIDCKTLDEIKEKQRSG